MDTKALIKYHRKRLGLTQEELGAKFGVNKAAVQKWESGAVPNIKRKNILQLAELFEITPNELMCWDEVEPNDCESEKEVILKRIKEYYGEDGVKLLRLFNQLNTIGKQKIIENISDYSELSKYTD